MALALGSNPGSWATAPGDPILELSITLAANSKVLALWILNPTTTARTGGAPTFAGTALTQAGTSQAGPSEFNAEMWYLLNPSLSTSSLSIPNNGSLTIHYYYVSFTTTSGAAYFDVAQGANTTANPSLTINSVPAGGACVAVLADGYKNAPTARSHTVLRETDMGAYSYNCQYGLIADLGNVSMSWTVSADNWAMIMAAFQEGLAALGASVEQAAKLSEELAASVAAQTTLGPSVSQSAKLTEVLGAEVMAPVVEPLEVDDPQQAAKLTEELAVNVAAQPTLEVTASQSAKATEDLAATVVAQVALAPAVEQTARTSEDLAAEISVQPTLEVTTSDNARVTEVIAAEVGAEVLEDLNIQVTAESIHIIDYIASPLRQSASVTDVVAAEISIQTALTPSVEQSAKVTEDLAAAVGTQVVLEPSISENAKVSENLAAAVSVQPTLEVSKVEGIKATEDLGASAATPVVVEINAVETVRATEVRTVSVEGLLATLEVAVAEVVKTTEATATQVIAQVALELATIDSVAVIDAPLAALQEEGVITLFNSFMRIPSKYMLAGSFIQITECDEPIDNLNNLTIKE